MGRKEPKLDYNELARNLDALREMLRATVAGFMADGFTEEQARMITAGMFKPQPPEDE